jgi:hypothetical protein
MDAIDQDVVVQDGPIFGVDDVPLPPLPITHLGVKWMKDGSKWC